MDAVQERIDAFGRLEPDVDGECHGKTTIIEELEDRLDDERVLSFYLRVIASPGEFDLARITALKVFQLWEAPTNEVHVLVGRQLAALLPVEDDTLVQQWIAIAAENFASVPEVYATAARLLADKGVDLDVRYNCLAVIERLRGAEEAMNVLRSLVDDKELAPHVHRILSEWDAWH